MPSPTDLFDELYQAYFAKVYRYFSVCFGVQIADDLSQQTFLKLWSYLNSLGAMIPHNFRAWIFRVAVNVKNDFLRKKGTSPPLSEYDRELGNVPGSADHEGNLLDTISVESALQELCEKDREILLLKSSGLTSKEIGQIYHVSDSTIRSRLVGARQRFGQILYKYGVNQDE